MTKLEARLAKRAAQVLDIQQNNPQLNPGGVARAAYKKFRKTSQRGRPSYSKTINPYPFTRGGGLKSQHAEFREAFNDERNKEKPVKVKEESDES